MQKQQFEKQQQTKNKCFLIFLFIKKGKRVVKKKRKRNNATGNQALKKPIQIKDLYLTLNMICTFFALQRYHIVLESNMAALIEKKKRKNKKRIR